MSQDYGTVQRDDNMAGDGAKPKVKSDYIEDFLTQSSKKCGLYQVLFALTVQYAAILGCFNYTIMSWSSLEPDLTCNDDQSSSNLTQYCDILEHCHNYSTETEFYSLVNAWNLTTCFNKIGHTFDVRRFLTSMQAIGFAVGGILTGPMADRWGRKWVVFASNFIMLSIGVGSGFAPRWQVLAGLLFVMSLCRSVGAMPQIVQGMESTPMKYRLAISIASQWELAYILSAVIAYLTKNWSHYILITTCASLPILILMFLSAESPRWLAQQNRFEESAAVLNQIAWINGSILRTSASDLKFAFENDSDDKDQSRAPGRSCEIVREVLSHLYFIVTSRKLMLLTSLAVVIRMTESIIDVSFQFNLNDFFTNPFVSIGMYGLIRIWCPILAICLDVRYKWFSRRLYFLVSLLFVGIFNTGAVISALLLQQPGTPAHLSMTIFFILADVINNGLLYSAVTQVVAETYPTSMRSTGFSILGIAAGVGEIFGNLLLELQPFWHPAPYVIVEASLIACVVVGYFVVPETKGKPLPDSSKDI